MTNCIADRAKIIPGSKAEFDLFLIDEAGRAKSLSPYVSGKLVFLNCNGVRTEITLPVPGANPDSGKIAVVITAIQSANADDKWKDADIELTDSGAEVTIIPIADKFEIQKRFAPPVVP